MFSLLKALFSPGRMLRWMNHTLGSAVVIYSAKHNSQCPYRSRVFYICRYLKIFYSVFVFSIHKEHLERFSAEFKFKPGITTASIWKKIAVKCKCSNHCCGLAVNQADFFFLASLLQQLMGVFA